MKLVLNLVKLHQVQLTADRVTKLQGKDLWLMFPNSKNTHSHDRPLSELRDLKLRISHDFSKSEGLRHKKAFKNLPSKQQICRYRHLWPRSPGKKTLSSRS